jgi:hypothetical protein
MKDLFNNIFPVQLMAPADKAHATWYSNYVDLQGYEGVVIEVNIGALTGGSSSDWLTLALYEVDAVPATFSGYSAVAAADLQSGLAAKTYTGVGDYQVQRVGYHGSKRYVCLRGTYTSTGISAGIIGVSAIVGISAERPINAAPTTGAVS